MPLIYITGVEGTGKSTICNELVLRGFTAYDMDELKIAAICDRETGEVAVYPRDPAERTRSWRKAHSWCIVSSRFDLVEDQAANNTVILCGTAENETDFLHRFSLVIALVADVNTIKDRLLHRSGKNNYGKNPNELETVLQKQSVISGYYSDIGAHLIDSTQPIEKVVREIIAVIQHGVE